MTSESTFPLNGDYIGTESWIDPQNDNELIHSSTSNSGCTNHVALGKTQELKSSNRTKKKEKKELPSPMPLLARTENLPSHMPWVLKRYYTSDGRLILKEEKVRHHEYFRAHRANGRLTLQLVPLDDDDILDSLPHFADQNNEFLGTGEVEGRGSNETKEENNDINDQGVKRCTDEDKSTFDDEVAVEKKGVVDADAASKYLNTIRVRSAPSCLFEMPVRPIRTVYS